jgi:hypothetical protein
MYGTFKSQGAFVYKINLQDGFEFKGQITHLNESELSGDYYWCWDSSSHVSRTLFIDDILYTISDNFVKMNSLDDLSEINSIFLE